jgi:hypothetical protein
MRYHKKGLLPYDENEHVPLLSAHQELFHTYHISIRQNEQDKSFHPEYLVYVYGFLI